MASAQILVIGRKRVELPTQGVKTALAHVIGDKAEQAYRPGDALEKRRKLMESWAR
jgi:hypothetical protein